MALHANPKMIHKLAGGKPYGLALVAACCVAPPDLILRQSREWWHPPETCSQSGLITRCPCGLEFLPFWLAALVGVARFYRRLTSIKRAGAGRIVRLNGMAAGQDRTVKSRPSVSRHRLGRHTHALEFPCRRILGSWIGAGIKERAEVHP